VTGIRAAREPGADRCTDRDWDPAQWPATPRRCPPRRRPPAVTGMKFRSMWMIHARVRVRRCVRVRVRVRVDTGVCARARASMCAGARVCGLPHKNGVGTLFPDLSLGDLQCFIGSCKAHCRSFRMASFSKEQCSLDHFYYCVKLGQPSRRN
jgi:hypothetical protein